MSELESFSGDFEWDYSPKCYKTLLQIRFFWKLISVKKRELTKVTDGLYVGNLRIVDESQTFSQNNLQWWGQGLEWPWGGTGVFPRNDDEQRRWGAWPLLRHLYSATEWAEYLQWRMKVGLIDVDSHNYPNLPLMKLSAFIE